MDRATRKQIYGQTHIIFHPLYETWRSMKRRCYEVDHHNYGRYGARGIKICERWLNSFAAFVADMGPKPSPEYTVDRINPDGNYEPANCRWATPKQQCDERRKLPLKWAGKLPRGWTILAREAGLHHQVVMNRVIKFGWSLERALSTPANKQWDGSKNRAYPKKAAQK